ncbi:MAG: anthranilate synthase component I [Chitinispirillaceae bacterium]|nr:anthranilate synthase component I [Chitinispirillaceae bacterium]
MVFPTLAEVKNLAAGGIGTVIPVCKAVLADTETPVSVWLKLFRNEKYSFLLESVEGQDTVARYSFLGGSPFLTFSCRGTSWEIRGEKQRSGKTDPLGKLRELLAVYKPAAVDGIPRFSGGAVGFFSYDAIRLSENIPDKNPKDDPLDDIFFGFYRDIIAFDNREHRLLIIANIITDADTVIADAYADALARIAVLERQMATPLSVSPIAAQGIGEPRSNFRQADFKAAVEKCRDYIRAGDIFQVVLSQRFSVQVDVDSFDLYRILRAVNPSPYMFHLAIGDASVIGASPEMLVRVENRTVEVRPIAGTRRRGKTPVEDEALIAELLADPKERAEHIMLVDLGRNDVGRVSDAGSVQVSDLMHVEKYSHVIHLVSNVRGRLAHDKDALDALFSCFPAGTLSGAPKIRAMEIIDELEPVKRGLYGGALGYIDWSGTLDTCIVIRTIIYKNRCATIQAGAGIVADSDPGREYQETLEKAGALFAAIKKTAGITGE